MCFCCCRDSIVFVLYCCCRDSLVFLYVFFFCCRDFLHTSYSQMTSIFGYFRSNDLTSEVGLLGAIMFVLYQVLLVHIWLNIFIVLVCDAHAEVITAALLLYLIKPSSAKSFKTHCRTSCVLMEICKSLR